MTHIIIAHNSVPGQSATILEERISIEIVCDLSIQQNLCFKNLLFERRQRASLSPSLPCDLGRTICSTAWRRRSCQNLMLTSISFALLLDRRRRETSEKMGFTSSLDPTPPLRKASNPNVLPPPPPLPPPRPLPRPGRIQRMSQAQL